MADKDNVLDVKSGKIFDHLLSGMQDGFALCQILRDEEGRPCDCRILAVNPAFERLMGVQVNSLIGKSAHTALPFLKQIWIKVYDEAVSGKAPMRTLCHLKERGQYFEITAYSTEKDNIAVIFTDVTDRSRAQDEHKRLQSQLFQAQKMEAIGRLAGGVAHDFNNLLTAIQGYADLALLQFEKKAIVKESLEQIRKATERAARLSHQLLIFSRKEPVELQPRDLNDIIVNLCEMLKRIIGENISIEFEFEPDIWVTRVNQGQIEQVIMNLAVNARDAMPQGGKLRIKTKNLEIDSSYCESYSYARAGRFVCLSVEDTGVGMDKETMDQIFEPFFTTKKTGEGTGLGLCVVYGIVEEHGGWINVYSELGRGTVFRIYFPASSGRIVREEQLVPSVTNLRGRGERILLVEDEKIILNFMRKRLSEEGYVVFTAENVEDAMNIYEAENSVFDLLFTDVVLPDKTGIELMQKLFMKNQKLKVLLTSGYDYKQSEWPVLSDMNVQFIQKPYTVNGLLLAIRSSIDQEDSEE